MTANNSCIFPATSRREKDDDDDEGEERERVESGVTVRRERRRII